MPRYRLKPHNSEGPFSESGEGEGPELRSIETTYTDTGDDIYFCSGYGAREIAQSHQRKWGGAIYVNTVSRTIVRADLQQTAATPVQYAVAKAPVFTVIRADGHLVRAYWPTL